MHLNEYLGSLADLWPAMKLERDKEELQEGKSSTSSSAPAPSPAPATAPAQPPAEAPATAPATAKSPLTHPLRQQSLSLRDGLLGAGVGEVMMGVADAGYGNTVGAAMEDTSLMGTCFIENEWDVDGDRTFVLKVSKTVVMDRGSRGGRLQQCALTLLLNGSSPVDPMRRRRAMREIVLEYRA